MTPRKYLFLRHSLSPNISNPSEATFTFSSDPISNTHLRSLAHIHRINRVVSLSESLIAAHT